MSQKSKVKNSGFTLIEILVSVAIFTIVMVIALGALLAMSESDRKAQTLKSVINNLNFSMDSMSRTMRTGQNYHCDQSVAPQTTPRDCTGGSPDNRAAATSVAFRAADGAQVVYCLGTGSSCGSSGTAILRSVNGSTPSAITASEVLITGLSFYVTGAEQAALQPKVTMLISGSVSVNGSQYSTFNLQASVTQRLYDQ